MSDSIPPMANETPFQLSENAPVNFEFISNAEQQLSNAEQPLSNAEQPRSRRKRPRRKRTNWPLLTIAICIFCIYVFYVFVLPEIQVGLFRSRSPKKMLPPELALKWSARNLLRTCEFLFVCWFFYLGASIGSFLNVVAGRMPEGRTIVFGGSKCSFCNTRLSFLDNTPVLGWLLLQGKCRTCRLPIAPRYLIIEVVIGTIFVWMGLWELVSAGSNLPHWDSSGRSGLTSLVLFTQWQLIAAALSHAGLFAVLIMLGVANEGRKPFPILPFLVMAAAVASPKIFNPALDFVTWSEPFQRSLIGKLGPIANPLVSILLGGLSGLGLGWVSWFLIVKSDNAIVQRHWILQCILIGSVLGWQSVVTIVLCSLIVYGTMRAIWSSRSVSTQWFESVEAFVPSICLIAICMLHHTLWRKIAYLIGIV